AARGHRVTLLERGEELGGKIRLAQRLPGREELADFADWLAPTVERAAVAVGLPADAPARGGVGAQEAPMRVAGRAGVRGRRPPARRSGIRCGYPGASSRLSSTTSARWSKPTGSTAPS